MFTQHKIHLVRPNHKYAKKCIRYDIPNLVNTTPHNNTERIYTQPARFLWICKKTLLTNISRELQYYKLLYICSRN